MCRGTCRPSGPEGRWSTWGHSALCPSWKGLLGPLLPAPPTCPCYVSKAGTLVLPTFLGHPKDLDRRSSWTWARAGVWPRARCPVPSAHGAGRAGREQLCSRCPVVRAPWGLCGAGETGGGGGDETEVSPLRSGRASRLSHGGRAVLGHPPHTHSPRTQATPTPQHLVPGSAVLCVLFGVLATHVPRALTPHQSCPLAGPGRAPLSGEATFL